MMNIEWIKSYSKTFQREYWFNVRTKQSVWDLSEIGQQYQQPQQQVAIETKNPKAPEHVSVNAEIIEFYNNRKRETFEERIVKQSSSQYIRNFNNWVKWVALENTITPLSTSLKRKINVGDFACGQGGDLLKFKKLDRFIQRLTGYDIAPNAIEEAKRRAQTTKLFFKVDYQVCNLTTPLQVDGVTLHEKFDFINMQFAIHYAFQDEQLARQLLKNVSESLNKGGIFLCSTIDSDEFLDFIHNHKTMDGAPSDLTTEWKTINCFDQANVKIVVASQSTNDVLNQKCDQSLDNCDPFFSIRYKQVLKSGDCYYFTLKGLVENCIEYFVTREHLINLAAEYGLKLQQVENFQDFYYRWANQYMDLFTKNVGFSTSSKVWNVIKLYCIYTFVKI